MSKDAEDDQASVVNEMVQALSVGVGGGKETSTKAGSAHAYISRPESKPATETYRPRQDKTYVMTGSLVFICRL